MSTNDKITYTPVRQLVRVNMESIYDYPSTVWQLIATQINEILVQHGCVILPGQTVDLRISHRAFRRWIVNFELFVTNGQSFYGNERMATELRDFAVQAGANKFEIDFENVR